MPSPTKKAAAAAPRRFKQERSARTHGALLDAAKKVFTRLGYERAQTPEIAAAAGVSTGAFYRYFSDKRRCFLEMMGRELERAHQAVTERLDPVRLRAPDARKVIDTALEALFAHMHQDPALGRVYLALSLTDPDVARLRAEYEARSLAVLTELVAQVVPRKRAPNPRATALVIHLSSLEVASHMAGLRPQLTPAVPPDDVRRALADMLDRYLFHTSPRLV